MPANKYKLIYGNGRDINTALEKEAKDGWTPILFDSTPADPPVAAMFSIILEQKPGASKE